MASETQDLWLPSQLRSNHRHFARIKLYCLKTAAHMRGRLVQAVLDSAVGENGTRDLLIASLALP